jgi:superfamily II DNA or RNA helicase
VNLRPYQSDCVAAVESGFENFTKQLAVLPTGAGKTIIFAKLAAGRAERGERTLILAHRSELIYQAVEKIFAATGIRAETEKAEEWAGVDESTRIVVGSVQTMTGDRLNRWPSDFFSLVVADEAHHAMSDSWRKTLAHFDGNADVLGVTATPDRNDKRNLGQYFENVAFEIGLFDLIRDGYLSPIAVKSLPLEIDLRGVKVTAGDFDDAQLGHALEPYLASIAKEIKAHAEFRRTLAFLPLIATSQKFVAACRDAGIDAEHADGDSPDRAQKLARFERGEFSLLSNAMLLTEGYDCPPVDCVAMLRPTSSRALYSQCVGRGTRVCDFKENLLLLDFLWLTEKHKLSRPAHLVAKSEDEAEEITKLAAEKSGAKQDELELEGLASEVQAQREAKLRQELKEHSRKSSRIISADEFAIANDAFAVAEFEPTMKWESEPPTPKQEKYLRAAKIKIETVRGRGHARQLLDLHFRNQSLRLATPKQVSYLSRRGFPQAHEMTFNEARRAIAGLAKN